jgi:hypothetical protein
MTGRSKMEDSQGLSAEDMRVWLASETADIERAKALRITEATGFVDAYARKQISEKELENRLYEYSGRWGDPLPGVSRSEGMTDKQIISRLNKARVADGTLDPETLRRRKKLASPQER